MPLVPLFAILDEQFRATVTLLYTLCYKWESFHVWGKATSLHNSVLCLEICLILLFMLSGEAVMLYNIKNKK
jgi:hypothetical protein